jgi:hypothetical protein
VDYMRFNWFKPACSRHRAVGPRKIGVKLDEIWGHEGARRRRWRCRQAKEAARQDTLTALQQIALVSPIWQLNCAKRARIRDCEVAQFDVASSLTVDQAERVRGPLSTSRGFVCDLPRNVS